MEYDSVRYMRTQVATHTSVYSTHLSSLHAHSGRYRVATHTSVHSTRLRSLHAHSGRQENSTPTTDTLTCPIDVAALRAFAATAAADESPQTKKGKPYRGTYREIVQQYLARVTPGANGAGSVTIRYKHAHMGAALMDAGMIVASREYTRPEDWYSDPFCLPKVLKHLAMARIGYDFDDDAAHPHAQAACVVPGRDEMKKLLRGDNRKCILEQFGRIMWPREPDSEERRDRAKAAFAVVRRKKSPARRSRRKCRPRKAHRRGVSSEDRAEKRRIRIEFSRPTSSRELKPRRLKW